MVDCPKFSTGLIYDIRNTIDAVVGESTIFLKKWLSTTTNGVWTRSVQRKTTSWFFRSWCCATMCQRAWLATLNILLMHPLCMIPWERMIKERERGEVKEKVAREEKENGMTRWSWLTPLTHDNKFSTTPLWSYFQEVEFNMVPPFHCGCSLP